MQKDRTMKLKNRVVELNVAINSLNYDYKTY